MLNCLLEIYPYHESCLCYGIKEINKEKPNLAPLIQSQSRRNKLNKIRQIYALTQIIQAMLWGIRRNLYEYDGIKVSFIRSLGLHSTAFFLVDFT